jgi:hypothetical protein
MNTLEKQDTEQSQPGSAVDTPTTLTPPAQHPRKRSSTATLREAKNSNKRSHGTEDTPLQELEGLLGEIRIDAIESRKERTKLWIEEGWQTQGDGRETAATCCSCQKRSEMSLEAECYDCGHHRCAQCLCLADDTPQGLRIRSI